MLKSEKIAPTDKAGANVLKNSSAEETVSMVGSYTVECIAADGTVRWSETIENLVVNVGKIDLLDKYFSGTTYTAAWYLGLVDGASAPTYNAADTMSSHAGWTESVAYSNATRPAPSWGSATAAGGGAGSAGTGSKATTATAFNINGTATVAGAFLTTGSAKSGTTGILYSAGSFTGGSRAVINGDTLNVTYTAQC
jgi:hypothetical protein